jgi:methyl-accepting chemotaxis protein
MILYWLVGMNLATRRGTHSKFADSLYYLGFLFTLAALAAALYFLARPGIVWNEAVRNELIGRFGLALGTTILGLALRVAIVNVQPTEESAVEAAEDALARSIDKFRDQLDLHTDRLGMLSDKQHEMLSTMTDTAYSALADKTKGAGKELSEAFQGAGQAIQQSATEYTSHLKAKSSEMVLPEEYFRSRIEGPLENIVKTTSQLAEALKDSVEAQRVISDSAKSMAKKYESVTDASETMTTFVEAGADVVDEMGKMIDGFQQMSTTIESVGPAVRNASRAIEKETEEARQVSATFLAVAKESRKIAAAMAHQVNAMQLHNKSLEQELAKSRVATSRVHENLTDAVHALRKEIVER